MEKYFDIAIRATLEAGEKILDIYRQEDFGVEKKADHSPLTLADKAAHNCIVSYLQETPYPILSEEGKDIAYEERKEWNRFWLVDPLDGTKEFIKKNGEFTVNIALIEKHSPIFGLVFAPVLKELYIGFPGKGSWRIKDPYHSIDLRTAMSQTQISSEVSAKDEALYKVVVSRSHLNSDTENYLGRLRETKGDIELIPTGSSLKLCLVASGRAYEYPRLGPTMEWDIAAAHAVVKGSGGIVQIFESKQELQYNKENLLNPYFLVKGK